MIACGLCEWKRICAECTSYDYNKRSSNSDGKQFHQYQQIRVITKLPNSEQSYKGKVKTHKYINRQNQSTTGKL